MNLGALAGIVCAVLLHAGFIFFGGLLVGGQKEDHGTLAEVDLLSDELTQEKKDEPEEPEEEPLETETEEPPDAAEILRNLEQPVTSDAPELEAASLSAIEAALSGQAGGGDFSDALSFTSGGRIGGTGKAGALDEKLEGAFSLAEIDQKPRPIFQSTPIYPSQMRGKKMDGVVTLAFVVDAAGKVANPRVESATHPAFEKPAVDAVKKWKFEPAVKGGKRVACKMRVPIRFQPS